MAADGIEKGVRQLVEAAKPGFRDAHDVLAFGVHAVFLQKGYVCNGLGEGDARKDLPRSECPKGWNDSKEGYCFRYRGKDGKDETIVKMMRLGASLVVYVSKIQKKPKLFHAQFVPRDRIDASQIGGASKSSPSSSDSGKLFVDLGSLVRDLNQDFLLPLSGQITVEKKDALETSKDKSNEEPKPQHSQPHPKQPTPMPLRPQRPDPRMPTHPGLLDPTRPSFNPFSPDTGMLVGPRNPRFGGTGLGPIPQRGRRPGRGRLPGARFDPFGPFPGSRRGPGPDHFRIPGRDFDDEDII